MIYRAIYQALQAGHALQARRPSGVLVVIVRVPNTGLAPEYFIEAGGRFAYFGDTNKATEGFLLWAAGGAWAAVVRVGVLRYLLDDINDAQPGAVLAALTALYRGQPLQTQLPLDQVCSCTMDPATGVATVALEGEAVLVGDAFDACRYYLNAVGAWRAPRRHLPAQHWLW